jgi:hypothetical protein
MTEAHRGYVDAINGSQPSECRPGSDYETGYLAGIEDLESGTVPDLAPNNLRVGQKARVARGVPVNGVPAKRSYVVTVRILHSPIDAFVTWAGEFSRPQPAEAIWAGSGQYWKRAPASLLEPVS